MASLSTSLTAPFATVAAVLWGSIAAPAAAQAPTPRMVEVEGRAVRVMTAGFEHLNRGQPVVVFESGAGTTIENWGTVFADVAAFAPVVAYERGGIGESEGDGEPPTPERRVEQLHALLAELEAPPLYVLVGHSWGGALIRAFAGRYPDEVAGLVYVDPTDFTERRADELAVFAEIGLADGEAGRDVVWQYVRASISQAPPGIVAEYDALMDWMAREPEERGLLPAPEVPVAVLLGTRYDPFSSEIEFPFEFRDYFEATMRQRTQKMSGWVREAPEGLFVVASYAGHYIHQDDPALVTHAVGRIVYPDVTRQLTQALAASGGEAVSETYRALKRRYPPERFNQDLLNTLGYGLLGDGRTDDALAVFELNVEAYPDSPNPYDSLGDAYSAAGRLEDARRSYERAVERAEQQGHPNRAYFRANLERVTRQLEKQ